MKNYQISKLNGQMEKVSASFKRTTNSYRTEDYAAFKNAVNDLNALIEEVDGEEKIFDDNHRQKTADEYKKYHLE